MEGEIPAESVGHSGLSPASSKWGGIYSYQPSVWGTLHALILQRGVDALRVSKVQGHATLEMVRAGLVRQQDRAGNDAAYAAVQRGCRAYKASRRALAELHEARAGAYTKLVVGI